MTQIKRQRLMLETAQKYSVLRKLHSSGKVSDGELAFAERCMEKAALVWAAGLTQEERSKIASDE